MFLDRFVRVQYGSSFMLMFVRWKKVERALLCHRVTVLTVMYGTLYYCFDYLVMVSILNSGRLRWIIDLWIWISPSHSRSLPSFLPLFHYIYLFKCHSHLSLSFSISSHTQLINDRVVGQTLLALEFLNEVLTSNITTIQSKWNGKHLKRFRNV